MKRTEYCVVAVEYSWVSGFDHDRLLREYTDNKDQAIRVRKNELEDFKEIVLKGVAKWAIDVYHVYGTGKAKVWRSPRRKPSRNSEANARRRVRLAKELEENLIGTSFEETQKLINGGHWGFEGSVGRYMMDCINAGVCMLGKLGCRDYYGNYVPSRWEVKPGTKGSPEYVAARQDEVLESEIDESLELEVNNEARLD